ncbi:hypothetical protein ACWEO4_20300 [Streptomyces sp. NPDC004393]|uniref:hypothetical protein n=1 Tax=Streptomyces sp. NPDC004533 TaxID=3154278 RepID=UPI00339F106E
MTDRTAGGDDARRAEGELPPERAERRQAADARSEGIARRRDLGSEGTDPREAADVRPAGVGYREEADMRSEETYREAAGLRPERTRYRETAGPGTTGAREPAAFRPEGASGQARLLPRDECEQFALRLRHAIGEFVDEPRDAVEEADRVAQEVVARLSEAVASRRRTLKASWQDVGEDARGGADTEQLRLALRDYRLTVERLLNL